MKRTLYVQHPLCRLIALGSLLAGFAARASAEEFVPGELLVGFKSAKAAPSLAKIALQSVGEISGPQPVPNTFHVRLKPGVSVQDALSQLRRRSDVRYAEPNYRVHAYAAPNDSDYAKQYAPQITLAERAWEIWKPKATVVIAILDHGVDVSHPDLYNKILRDSSGVVGYDAFTHARGEGWDDEGHGTHCAGIAAAQVNNGTGVAGIAGWDGAKGSTDSASIKIMPVRVLNREVGGTDAAIADGIRWAADHGAKVISMSLGRGGSGSNTTNDAVQYAWSKGCVIVAAAGNDGSSDLHWPAAYDNVISVANTDSRDTLYKSSNWGAWVKVAAPGADIYSTTPTYNAGAGWPLNYANATGTSMACPLVAGEAALLLAQNPNLSNRDAAGLIVSNVEAYNPYSGRSIASGAGRVNVYRALQAAGKGSGGGGAKSKRFDLNGDGKTDILWRNTETGGVIYWLMDGLKAVDGGWLLESAGDWKVMGTADFNGDGKADILWQNLQTGGVVAWIMDGTKPVDGSWLLESAGDWRIRSTPDFNNDGKADILWQNASTGQAVYWIMDGLKPVDGGWIAEQGNPTWKIVGTMDPKAYSVGVILWQNQQTGAVVYWVMDGVRPIDGGCIIEAAGDWKVASVADYNSDGKPDLLWQNAANGAVVYWLLDGVRPIDGGYLLESAPASWRVIGPR